MAKRGPKLKLQTDEHWENFEKLCAIQCTAEEIAYFFSCSVDTIERAVKRRYGLKFAEVVEQKAVKGKISIRRGLFDLAHKGNLGALIWLSKNYLGMSDKVEQKTEIKGEQTLVYKTEWGSKVESKEE